MNLGFSSSLTLIYMYNAMGIVNNLEVAEDIRDTVRPLAGI